LLGTFLVRSGVLSSVHAFASDPKRGLFILGFLALVVGASLALFAWRAPKIGLGARFAMLSKETLLLLNNVLLLVATGAVLLGTLYPLALDALGLGKISVGAPYFETVFVPLMAPLVFLMGVGPLARWKQATLPDLRTRLRWALGVAVAAALLAGWAAGHIGVAATLGLAMAFWIVASVATDLVERLRPRAVPGDSVAARWRLLPRALLGMMVAHLGVAAFILGVTMVRSFEVERDVKMDVGDTTTARGYTFTFRGTEDIDGPNYQAARGLVEVSRAGRLVATLHPEKRVYRVQSNPMTEAAIDAGLTRDLYVSLGEPLEGRAWTVRVYIKPYIDWIWGGCGLMALGGLLAVSDRRYRSAHPKASAMTTVPASGEVPA
ncbi:MAG: cytochrome c-type biogenesis CcmF C-terminal domain-containing protein, partial [Burkholderiales bacterium]